MMPRRAGEAEVSALLNGDHGSLQPMPFDGDHQRPNYEKPPCSGLSPCAIDELDLGERAVGEAFRDHPPLAEHGPRRDSRLEPL